MPLFSDVYVAIVLIFGIVLATACYAVRRLESRPAQIASVIIALSLLVGALVPVVRLLAEPSAAPTEVVAPSVSGPTFSPTAPPAPGAAGPGPADLAPAGS
ncbi:hypothetical protein ACFYYH_34150 [Streptomyces sp. NPDC002018]|uniref:hypothetical protein n=1 Tax=Streptomyces sp. NPDC002018 TaxID=3364629 RepID=UPI0036977E83